MYQEQVINEASTVSFQFLPPLEGRASWWLQDLALKSKKATYYGRLEFSSGFESGFSLWEDFVGDCDVTFDVVLRDIELSLSRSSYERQCSFDAVCGFSSEPYVWYVGSLFGLLTALLLFAPLPEYVHFLVPVRDLLFRLGRLDLLNGLVAAGWSL